LLDTTHQFIEKNKAFLTGEELTSTANAMKKLQDLLANGSKDQVQSAIENLNEISRPYAERLMDEAIGKAMKGKSITAKNQ